MDDSIKWLKCRVLTGFMGLIAVAFCRGNTLAEQSNEQVLEPEGALIQRQPDRSVIISIPCESFHSMDGDMQWMKVTSPGHWFQGGQQELTSSQKSATKEIYFPIEHALGGEEVHHHSSCVKQFRVAEEHLLISSGDHPFSLNGLNQFSLVNFKKPPERKYHYSLKENGLYLIPIISAAAFIAMPHYKTNPVHAPLIHALISVIGSTTLYLQRDKECWQRLVESAPPLNQWDVIIPLISYGYSVYDLYTAIEENDPLFLLHGGGMFAVFSFFAATGRIHLLTDSLLMENSTIFLYLRKHHPHFKKAFSANFYLFRWGVFPYEWFKLVKKLYNDGLEYPGHKYMTPLIVGGGILFNSLNLYWGSKMMKIILFGRK